MTLSMIKTIETPQMYPEGKAPHNFQDSYSVGSYIIPILNTCTVFFNANLLCDYLSGYFLYKVR